MITDSLRKIARMSEVMQTKYQRKESLVLEKEEMFELITHLTSVTGEAYRALTQIDSALIDIKEYDKGGRDDLAGKLLIRLLKGKTI